MKIIINSTSMVPIYEQIMDKIKAMIKKGEIQSGEALPSVRGLSKELRISALTVKKAYDNLEEEGFVLTVQGKGTYVGLIDKEILFEEQKKDIEKELEKTIAKARRLGIDDGDIKYLFDLIMEDKNAEDR